MLTAQEEKIVLKHKQKELLALFRDAVSKLSKIRLESLTANIEATFGKDSFRFDITVFDNISDNATFGVYDFYDLKDSKKIIDGAIRAIKTDDFENVKSTAEVLDA